MAPGDRKEDGILYSGDGATPSSPINMAGNEAVERARTSPSFQAGAPGEMEVQLGRAWLTGSTLVWIEDHEFRF